MKKPPREVPWVRYSGSARMLELSGVSPEAELAHRRLSDWHWSTGEWPTTLRNSAAALCRVPPGLWASVQAELAALGWRVRGGRITHHGVHQVRADAVSALRSFQTRGRMGAERRWTAQEAPGQPSGPGGPPNGNHMAKPKLSHSSAIAKLKKKHSQAIAEPMQSKSKSKSKSRVKSTVHNTFNAERLTCSVSAHEKGSTKEQPFLREVKEVLHLWSPAFAQNELDNYGGWWRNRFRENPGKSGRVLAEIRSMIREGRISGNPGAAAMDLWKRFP